MWGDGGTALLILNLGTRVEVNGDFYVPVSLSPGKESSVSTE
jgi:hypothetical protein